MGRAARAGLRRDGLYLGLGIGDYSDRSHEAHRGLRAASAAPSFGRSTSRETTGSTSRPPADAGSRSTCAVCGLSKRYVFNTAALDGGYDVIATGHNLDDEAATLLGNTLRWNTEYIARQSPVLPAEDGMVKKVKPLHRLGARDGRVRVPARDRLRGRGVPARGRQHAAPVQGGDERDRVDVARHEGAVLPRLPRPRRAAVPRARTTPSSRRASVRPADHGTLLRVLPGRARRSSGERLGAEAAARRDREVAEELADEVLPAELYGGTPA